ncbi:MAG: hormogonium polysaccharide biosynthesis protein HpsA, partial [Crocosphaera sp.]|nr:hormogonium polysaccharide biosynthesis protein HpsA [Crocosphaera sp.]
MSKYKLTRSIQYLVKQIGLLLKLVTRQAVSLPVILKKIITHRTRFANSGFVLPTVTMVMLVVVLLSIAILLRSFDRAEIARNVRVDQATLAAATPALDRAKAKIEQMFNDSALPRSTPTDYSLYQVIGENANGRYKFGDETAIKIAFDFIDDNSIQVNDSANDPDDFRLEDNEETKTAWMFPVDTDNNGKYDTYTLYSILFRSPSRNDAGEFDRTRNALEARTPPMPSVETIAEKCKNAFGTSSGIVGDSDWYKSSTNLTKSFFVYTANVPITQEQLATLNTTDYEIGKAGVSALEYQQDRLRIPLNNNAVWFEEDLEVGFVSNFRLNGRVFTNGNLMARAGFNGPITFYQVSDPESCFYEAENAKIIVGGNVADGDILDSSAKEGGRKEVFVHKYKKGATPSADEIDGDNRTTTLAGGNLVGYDVNGYNERIGDMVDAALATVTTAPGVDCANCGTLPDAVQEQYKERADVGEDNRELLADVLESYYRSITRRVPFAEGTTNDSKTMSGYNPPDEWIDIGDNGLTIKEGTGVAFLPTSDPTLANNEEEEKLIGDRIYVGYGLAALDLDGNKTTEDFGNGIFWNDPNAANPETTASTNARTRETQIDSLPDLGATDRGLFWEKEAAKVPEAFDNSGGLRVVTGAGIYLANDPDPDNWQKENVWSDALPMALEPIATEDSNKDGIRDDVILDATNPEQIPYLQMRATAVYHYTSGGSTPGPNTAQTPIACVSSYYDPTNATTALNEDTLPWNDGADGRSNNGIVYNYVAVSDERLTVQAELKYPNGRYVNQPLRTALGKSAGDRLLQDYSAIHAAQCALNILDAPTSFSTAIPHGAIREASFLDAREVKSLNRLSTNAANLQEWLEIAELENLQPNNTTSFPVATPVSYNLPLEQRQPLEIRVTEIDLSQLRESGAEIGTGEYLLPNSGVIYATRDDALPDVSAVDADTSATGDINDPGVQEELLSTSDFK